MPILTMFGEVNGILTKVKSAVVKQGKNTFVYQIMG